MFNKIQHEIETQKALNDCINNRPMNIATVSDGNAKHNFRYNK